MHSREEAQGVVESSPIPPEEYSHTVRLCPKTPGESKSGATRKQTGLAAGHGLLLASKGSQHGESDAPHSLWAGLQTETCPPFAERGRWLQSA
jgi:hypothetical protein